MFTDSRFNSSSSKDNKRDDDGAKRLFFGGERFLEGISGEANVSKCCFFFQLLLMDYHFMDQTTYFNLIYYVRTFTYVSLQTHLFYIYTHTNKSDFYIYKLGSHPILGRSWFCFRIFLRGDFLSTRNVQQIIF